MSDVRTDLQRLWLATLVPVVILVAVPPIAGFVSPTGTVLGGPRPSPDLPLALPLLLLGTLSIAAAVAVVATDRLFVATPPTDDVDALRRLRLRLVWQASVAELPVLLATLLALLLGPGWLAAVGGAGTLLALLLARPSPRRLARLDAGWAAAGVDVSLRRGLTAGGADGESAGGADRTDGGGGPG
jgi:formate hydrogenlyase subunit 3/multisubunit Na+/H+ antiporter MnhD subunit